MADYLHPRSLIGPKTFENVDAAWPTKAYDATVGAHPMIEVPALAAAGGLLGYFGTGLAQHALGGLTSRLPGNMGAGLNDWLQDPENMRVMRERMAAILATAGGVAGLAKNLDVGGGVGGAARSLTESDYWGNNPEARKRQLQRRLATLLGRRYIMKANFQWQRDPRMQKQQSEEADPFFQPETPIRQSLEYVGVDPFLTNSQKHQTQGLLVASNNGQTAGYTSGHSLMKSAVKAGVGFGTAYLFGRVAGGLLAMPSETVKNLSLAGGLAGALINSGIFKELGGNMDKHAGIVGETYGVGKDVSGKGVDSLKWLVTNLAPIILMTPPAIGVGAGYLASKMTSPSKQDEEALGSEIETAELQKQVAEISRIRALARRDEQQQQQPKRRNTRGIRF